MGKELEVKPQRIVVYDAKKDGDWLLEASFPPGFKIVKVIGEKRKRVVTGNASDIVLD
jgi:hypothetical protein